MENVFAELGKAARDLRESIAFLSILPADIAGGEPRFAESARMFPLAGLVIGVLPAAIYFFLAKAGLSPLPCALLAITCLIVVTRGLHEDGLADVADGFWGGYSRERKLQIMRDSTIGTFGTLALILSLAIRTVLLAEVGTRLNDAAAAMVVVLIAGLSRIAILHPWTFQPSARSQHDANDSKPAESLSARYGAPSRRTFAIAAILSIPIALALGSISGFLATSLALLVGAGFVFALSRLCEHHIGGRTGDTLGATQQVAEWGLYLGLAAAI